MNKKELKKLEKMSYGELMDYYLEHVNYFTTYDTLKDFAIEQIEMENLTLAIHILEAINEYSTEYYIYDYSMGTLETPHALDEEELYNYEEMLKH